MLGLNSGLLGVRRTPTPGSASGIWVPNEQADAVRANVWEGGTPLGTYSQSSIYGGVTAATRQNMTNGSYYDTATGTNASAGEWVKIDYGSPVYIASVTIGTVTNNMPGGWSKAYTDNSLVQASDDESTWTTLFNTGVFPSEGIYTFYAPSAFTATTARYVRVHRPGSYVAVSEFYVNTPSNP